MGSGLQQYSGCTMHHDPTSCHGARSMSPAAMPASRLARRSGPGSGSDSEKSQTASSSHGGGAGSFARDQARPEGGWVASHCSRRSRQMRWCALGASVPPLPHSAHVQRTVCWHCRPSQVGGFARFLSSLPARSKCVRRVNASQARFRGWFSGLGCAPTSDRLAVRRPAKCPAVPRRSRLPCS